MSLLQVKGTENRKLDLVSRCRSKARRLADEDPRISDVRGAASVLGAAADEIQRLQDLVIGVPTLCRRYEAEISQLRHIIADLWDHREPCPFAGQDWDGLIDDDCTCGLVQALADAKQGGG